VAILLQPSGLKELANEARKCRRRWSLSYRSFRAAAAGGCAGAFYRHGGEHEQRWHGDVELVVERWSTDLSLLRLSPDPLVLVAEAVERPGNLGTIVRSACAAGADALVVADGRTDLFHPETVRGSVGTLFRLPLATATTRETIDWLHAQQLRTVVATPDADEARWVADLTGPAAVVVGNERYGLSRAWVDAADEAVRVPMPGPADSLNVAVAAGVVMYEAARQRSLVASIR